MTITIAPELKAFLEEQVGSGDYSSLSEFISALRKKKKLENLLLQRIDAGDADEMTPEAWNKLRIGDRPLPTEVSAPELAAWTNVARVILNLHETITRE